MSPLDGPSIDPGTEGAKLVGLYKYYTGKFYYISHRIWAYHVIITNNYRRPKFKKHKIHFDND